MDLMDRMSRVIRAKGNKLMEGFENNPEVVDQMIIDAKKELAELKRTAAPVYAAEKKAREDYEEYKDKADRFMEAAKAAVNAGNDADAEAALEASGEWEEKATRQEEVAKKQKASADSLRDKINTHIERIKDMENYADEIKADMANAKAAKATSKIGGEKSLAAFDRIADRAAASRAEAEAMMDMDAPVKDDRDDLLSKYGSSSKKKTLAELKAEMGK